jgi:hypothetical protein
MGRAPKPSPQFFCRRLHFSFAYAKHAFSTRLEAGKYCTFGARNAARNRADVMEIVASSPSDRRQVGQQRIRNGPQRGISRGGGRTTTS